MKISAPETVKLITETISALGSAVTIFSLGSGKTFKTSGVIAASESEDTANEFSQYTDKTIYVPGVKGMILTSGDTITFKTSKSSYQIISLEAYNLTDLASDTLAYKLTVRAI